MFEALSIAKAENGARNKETFVHKSEKNTIK
jgi:hypothetical protein